MCVCLCVWIKIYHIQFSIGNELANHWTTRNGNIYNFPQNHISYSTFSFVFQEICNDYYIQSTMTLSRKLDTLTYKSLIDLFIPIYFCFFFSLFFSIFSFYYHRLHSLNLLVLLSWNELTLQSESLFAAITEHSHIYFRSSKDVELSFVTTNGSTNSI